MMQVMSRSSNDKIITRFAPSPTGYLHLGHAHSALFAARAAGNDRFILRIEDIDGTRCRPEFTEAIFEDLAWLGLQWEEPVRLQSAHMDDYRAALARLDAMGLLYPCFCTRADIAREIAGASSAPHQAGPDGPLYPGTCRHLSHTERSERLNQGQPHALRLDMAKALQHVNTPLHWLDLTKGLVTATPDIFGDAVLARKETPTSYHLAVTVDDALQGINLVTRGEDLFAATHLHRLLQTLLGLPVPQYHHHGLLLAPDGRRLAKRDKAETLRDMRARGMSPAEARALAGFPD